MDRQTDQKASRRRDRWTNRRIYGETKVGLTNGQTDVLRSRQIDGKDRQLDGKQTHRWIVGWINRRTRNSIGQMDRQIDRRHAEE
jgi:hypothetical protein